MRARPDSLIVVCLLTCLVGLGPVSTDLYLPSLPAIAETFETDAGQVQLTLSVFMFGFAVSQLAYGPLADRFGRRPVLLLGLSIYLVATIMCFLAPSIEALIAARFLQALGACAGPVVARAVVRDVFPFSRAAQVLSYMAMAMALAPAVGPIVGGQLQIVFGWRATFALLAIFAVLVIASVLVILPETNANKDPKATRPGRLLTNYRTMLADPVYRGYVAVLGLTFSGLFAFISGSSFVLIEVVGLRPDAFGFSFAGVVAGYMVGTFASARMTRKLGPERTVSLGLAIALLGAVPMALFAFAGFAKVATVVPPMAVFMAGAGMVLPNATVGAVGRYRTVAGTASALLGFLQMGTGAVAGVAVGQLADGTARPMAGVIALVAVLAAAAHWRGHPARRAAEAAAE
ncbi:multidrug effflux MFS transporter [Ferruginivarius sediminum]|uniref:multidrug effflux MFS transporter n=1 Tax=Ferruginivarius sediminum TaxID=2661937 RepID=UPI001F4EDFB5|nr:multidrug effflux MFS transporter [Ferruginivarius sediminum]